MSKNQQAFHIASRDLWGNIFFYGIKPFECKLIALNAINFSWAEEFKDWFISILWHWPDMITSKTLPSYLHVWIRKLTWKVLINSESRISRCILHNNDAFLKSIFILIIIIIIFTIIIIIIFYLAIFLSWDHFYADAEITWD